MTDALAYRTVLVADPSGERGAAIVAALVRRGFAATAVQAAHLALRLAAARPPDAWIVDQDLPGISGAQLVSMIRASATRALRDAVIVGTATARTRVGFTAAGVDVFVPAPATPAALADAVDGALSKHAAAESPGK
ncbi:response regulator [Anaeromyxobacter oryzae]|nr:response regulator [Anaeromyxobacter oryzae]